MIRLQELKAGDYVMAEFEGERVKGVVKDVSRDGKMACVETDVQEFWFDPEVLHPIPLDEEQLLALNFQRQELPDYSVKYLKGPFRILLTTPGDFSRLDMWYREDRRHIDHHLTVHELQNHYSQMTKVDLTNN